MRKISFIVIGVHCAVLLFMALFSSSEKNQKKHPLVVRTVRVAPAVQTKEIAVAAQKAPVQEKKVAPVNSKKKNPTPTAKPTKKTTAAPTVPRALLKELEESIAKIDQKRDKIYQRKDLKVPKWDAPGKIEIKTNIEDRQEIALESSYSEELVEILKESLHLPEYGEVKMQLKLNRDGSVLQVIVLKTESQKNKAYLQTELPRLKFPPLNVKKKEVTFTLTFCNEI